MVVVVGFVVIVLGAVLSVANGVDQARKVSAVAGVAVGAVVFAGGFLAGGILIVGGQVIRLLLDQRETLRGIHRALRRRRPRRPSGSGPDFTLGPK
jgi:hypothetical protein